jgi:outer membrane protein insertion porin family/translocation and assembly module TamA
MATLVTSRGERRGRGTPAPSRGAAIARALALGAALAAAQGCTQIPPGRYAIDDVEIEGNSKVEAAEIEDKIATAASPRFLGLFRGVVLDYELYDPYILERDLARIERLYRARGFYEAHARAGRVQKIDETHVRVSVVVDEGPAVTVRDIKVQGIATLPIDDAAAALSVIRRRLRAGRNFDEDRYEQAKDGLLHAFTDRGYAYAKVEGRVEVDLAHHVADVFFDVTPGQVARLGSVTITGLGPLPEGPVRRALDLSESELYSTEKLDAAKRAVLGLGVFSEVEIQPDLSQPGSPTVPVKVIVTPSELRSVKLGGGIELDVVRTDVHALTGWEDRNFLGGLRRFNIDLRPGLVVYPTRLPKLEKPERLLPEARARAELRQPGVIEARTGGIVRGEINVYPVIWYVEDNNAPPPNVVPGYLDLSAGYGFDRSFGPFYANLSYNFQNSFPFNYGSDVQTRNKVVLSYIDLKTTLDLRNDAIRPHSGVFISNDFQVAGLPVLSNFRSEGSLFASDLRLLPEVRGYLPLARRWTLALRGTVGFLLPFPGSYGESFRPGVTGSPSDIQLVFFRGFFSGGPNSNRGYPYRGVGPMGYVSEFLPGVPVDQLFPTGGLTLWEASAEVRFPISGDLGGVAFCDASDVSRYRFDIRVLYPHLSCGAGLHYNTPVGAIGLDVGFPIPGAQSFDKNAAPSDKVAPDFYNIAIGIEAH